MSWSPTPNREAVDALAALWLKADWRASPQASEIQSILLEMLDSEDEVKRLRTTQVARLLADDDEAAYELVRNRLLAERQPHVAAALLDQLRTFCESRAAFVDDTVIRIAQAQPWTDLLAANEGEPDFFDPLGVFVSLVLLLAIRHQTPASTRFIQEWGTSPTRTRAAKQALQGLRGWLALPAARAPERARAFEVLGLAIASVGHMVDSAKDGDEAISEAFQLADSCAHNLYFASGAHAGNGEAPQTPDMGFVDQALPALEALTKFRHPRITHSIIETLSHIAPLQPGEAFLVVKAAISTGDRYTYDTIAVDKVTALIERYLAEFRELVVKDPELLDAIRSVLHAFVDAGWPSALNLVYRLSDAFR